MSIATLLDNATVLRVEITNTKATGITYSRNGETVTVNARKLVVLSAGAIGTPLILRDSGVYDLNQIVGNYLRAHPGVPIDALLPSADWGTERGYQWNVHHHVMDGDGNPLDAVVHASAGFPATTPWVAAAFKIGLFEVAVGELNLKTGKFVGGLRWRTFWNQDLLTVILTRNQGRIAPQSFLLEGPAFFQKGPKAESLFR
jgi:choline dehydrogenase-like flavoprotein